MSMAENTTEPTTFSHTGLPDVVELKNVSQSYDDGGTFIIKDFNLLIEDKPKKGQFIVILGESGCGKSTILRYIAGLQQPTTGEVLIDGKPVNPDDPISMVFQQYSSFPWMTVLDNVMLPLKFKGENQKKAREMASDMISKVGLEDHVKKYAQYPLLSGGQLQRVAIARSLVTNPRIIVMDEPFGALDINTRFQMQLLLNDLWEQYEPTIIFVTHDIQEAVFLGDDIYFMSAKPGKIIKRWAVDLPTHRERAIKKDHKYISLVQEIEDYVFEKISAKKSARQGATS
jgi:NitT/TauT family transport system ATP-binding protein